MADDRKDIVRRGEILPPEKRKGHELGHNPSGIIDSVTSGLVAGFETRSIQKDNAKTKAKIEGVELRGELARAIEDATRSLARLEDLPNTLDEDQRKRDHGRTVARVQEELQLTTLMQQTEEHRLATAELKQRLRDLERDHERRDVKADYNNELGGLRHAHDKETAVAESVAARTNRLINEAIETLVVEQKKYQALSGTLKGEAQYQQALNALLDFKKNLQPVDVAGALDELMRTLLDRVEDMKRQGQPPDKMAGVFEAIAELRLKARK